MYTRYRDRLPPTNDVVAAFQEAISKAYRLDNSVRDGAFLSRLLLVDDREDIRLLAAIVIGVDNRQEECEMALLAALEDESETIRRTVAQALVDLGTVRGLSAVAGRAGHGRGIRTTAAYKLRDHGSKAVEAIPSLFALLRYQDINWRSHVAAAVALAAIGDPAIPYLLHALNFGTKRFRYYAAMAIDLLGKPPEYLDIARELLEEGVDF